MLILLVPPGTEAAVDGAVAIEQDGGERQVVIKLKQGKVERIGVDDAGADELIQQRCQLRLVQDAGVNSGAGKTGNTAQDDQKGLARAAGFGESAINIVVAPPRVVLHCRLVLAHGAFTIFDRLGKAFRCEQNAGEHQRASEGFHEGSSESAQGLLQPRSQHPHAARRRLT